MRPPYREWDSGQGNKIFHFYLVDGISSRPIREKNPAEGFRPVAVPPVHRRNGCKRKRNSIRILKGARRDKTAESVKRVSFLKKFRSKLRFSGPTVTSSFGHLSFFHTGFGSFPFINKKNDGNFVKQYSFHSFAPHNERYHNNNRRSHPGRVAGIIFPAWHTEYHHGMNVAHHLGISKKTIYQYFKDKTSLINSLLEQDLATQLKDMQQIRKDSENAIDELMKMMQYMAAKLGRINPTLFYDLQKYHASAWGLFKKFKQTHLTAFVEDNLRLGIKQEYYRSDLQVKVLARLRLEEVEIGFNPACFPPELFKVHEVHLALLDHFMHGIVTLKGHRLINKYKQITENE